MQAPAAVNYNTLQRDWVHHTGQSVGLKKEPATRPAADFVPSALSLSLPTRIRIPKHPYLPGLGRGGGGAEKLYARTNQTIAAHTAY